MISFVSNDVTTTVFIDMQAVIRSMSLVSNKGGILSPLYFLYELMSKEQTIRGNTVNQYGSFEVIAVFDNLSSIDREELYHPYKNKIKFDIFDSYSAYTSFLFELLGSFGVKCVFSSLYESCDSIVELAVSSTVNNSNKKIIIVTSDLKLLYSLSFSGNIDILPFGGYYLEYQEPLKNYYFVKHYLALSGYDYDDLSGVGIGKSHIYNATLGLYSISNSDNNKLEEYCNTLVSNLSLDMSMKQIYKIINLNLNLLTLGSNSNILVTLKKSRVSPDIETAYKVFKHSTTGEKSSIPLQEFVCIYEFFRGIK